MDRFYELYKASSLEALIHIQVHIYISLGAILHLQTSENFQAGVGAFLDVSCMKRLDSKTLFHPK